MKNQKLFWAVVVLGLILINFLAARFHTRADLTQEKRYSLSAPTKRLLGSLKEPVRIDVFLKGDYPAGFTRFVRSTEEFLAEMKEYGRGNIQYNFFDPLQGADDSASTRIIDSLQFYYNLSPLVLQAPGKVGDEQTQKLVLPGAVVHYKDTAVGVNFLAGQKSFGTEPEQLAQLYNNVEASLEYNLLSAVQKATSAKKPVVAYALGNGEAWGPQVDDAVRTLFSSYNFDTLNLQQTPAVPPVIDALVILKPTIRFSDRDKQKLDNYVMNGGKLFWMVENVYAEFDSLYKSAGFIAFDRGLNLEDLLFNYGVRINQTLLQDRQSDQLPQVSPDGQQQRLVSWPYFPVLNGTQHPISKNLDGVRAMFPTTIDTVEAGGIKKTALLQSSNNARVLQVPTRIDFEALQIAPDEKQFTQRQVPVAYLLEGDFRSLYTGRMPREFVDTLRSLKIPVKTSVGESSKMIVVSDGDIAMNQFSPQSGALPMGTNVFTRFTYANKSFFTNCLEYLVNPSDILQTRSKEFSLRLLDPRRTADEKRKWQLINLALPLLVVVLFAGLFSTLRRKRWAR